jgi:hypothetical protein
VEAAFRLTVLSAAGVGSRMETGKIQFQVIGPSARRANELLLNARLLCRGCPPQSDWRLPGNHCQSLALKKLTGCIGVIEK